MTSPFTPADLAVLRRPHIDKLWFGDFDLPAGRRRMHSGTGRITMAGYEWLGITDPLGSQMVGIQEIVEPRFGQAAAVNIIIAGINLDFFKTVRRDMADIEGRRAVLYWAAFDHETGQYVINLKTLFPGKMSSPTLQWVRGFGRVISLNVESRWHGQNFTFGGKWSSTGQRERYGDDSGGDFIGVKVNEIYR